MKQKILIIACLILSLITMSFNSNAQHVRAKVVIPAPHGRVVITNGYHHHHYRRHYRRPYYSHHHYQGHYYRPHHYHHHYVRRHWHH